MTEKSKLRVVCAWRKAKIRGPDGPTAEVSHGCCDTCKIGVRKQIVGARGDPEVTRRGGTGAKLWMSGERAGFDAHEHGVKVAALMADWQPKKLPGDMRVIHAPLSDDDRLDAKEFKATAETADRVASEVAVALLRGESVLVSCASGLNRSGLVCGVFLVRYARTTPGEAIMTIRERRSPYALKNKLFRRMIRAAWS